MDIQLVQYFVEVVKLGSFTKAASSLQVPKSTLSKAITKLEGETGTKLLIRSTRKQSLTTTGRAFYEKCLGPVQNITDAHRALFGQDNIISGSIKMSLPEDFEIFLLAEKMAELCKKYPNLSLNINSTNRVLDLVGEGYDFAVRLGPLKSSNLKVRRIGHIKQAIVASREYASGINLEKPSDLHHVRCIGISTGRNPQNWVLTNKKESRSIRIALRIESNHISSVMKLTEAGAGISILPRFLCQRSIDSGHLVEVLKPWSFKDYPVSLVSPVSTIDSARLKVISDEIVNCLKKSLG